MKFDIITSGRNCCHWLIAEKIEAKNKIDALMKASVCLGGGIRHEYSDYTKQEEPCVWIEGRQYIACKESGFQVVGARNYTAKQKKIAREFEVKGFCYNMVGDGRALYALMDDFVETTQRWAQAHSTAQRQRN